MYLHNSGENSRTTIYTGIIIKKSYDSMSLPITFMNAFLYYNFQYLLTKQFLLERNKTHLINPFYIKKYFKNYQLEIPHLENN